MELSDLRKKIGSREIIKGLDFEIHKGEVFGFIGPTGAGKTTTIRMMVGWMGITDGDVRILGKSGKSDFKEAIREVGGIVGNPGVDPSMTGRRHLSQCGRRSHGGPNK